MAARHSSWPVIVSGIIALLTVVAITAGWNLMFALYYLEAVSPETTTAEKVGYWFLMGAGDLALVLVAIAVAMGTVAAARRGRQLRRQDAFIDRITHELKTPVAALRLALDTVRRRSLSPEHVHDLHAGMRRNLDRLQALIDHVIEAGRLEEGSRDVVLSEVDPAAIIERCVERMSERHMCEAERFVCDLVAAPRAFRTDSVAFESIALNLLDNAIKYGGGSDVAVTLAGDARRLTLSVRDGGQGLARGETRKIFRRFHRSGDTATRRQPGSGLGLYIVAWLARRLGGRVRAESPGPHRGTTFIVDLPAPEPMSET